MTRGQISKTMTAQPFIMKIRLQYFVVADRSLHISTYISLLRMSSVWYNIEVLPARLLLTVHRMWHSLRSPEHTA